MCNENCVSVPDALPSCEVTNVNSQCKKRLSRIHLHVQHHDRKPSHFAHIVTLNWHMSYRYDMCQFSLMMTRMQSQHVGSEATSSSDTSRQ